MKRTGSDSYENELRLELSRKLALLLEVSAASNKKPYTFNEIAARLAEQGISLSRQRWSYMLNGNGPLVTEPGLLKALAELFHVPVEYLIPGVESEIPEKIDAQLATIRAAKHSKLKLIATRELGEVSPKTLSAITKLLTDNIEGNP